MPWDELEARLRALAGQGFDVVQFLGGEATLHPRFVDALALARRLGMATFVITNLLRWQDRDFARQVGPLLDEVMVSLHAWGPEAGRAVTGSGSFWESWLAASANARDTLRGRVRGSTVLTRASAPDLELIAGEILALGPQSWIMGNAVPTPGTRTDVVGELLTIPELVAMRPRLLAQLTRCAAAGCRLVFFCFPHCALGPEAWDDAHDLVIDDQDLSDLAPDSEEDVTFWSRADGLPRQSRVVLGRTRPAACEGCARACVCGGHFRAYFERHGTAGIAPVAGDGLRPGIPGDPPDCGTGQEV